ncbi:hypothetical protein WJX73_005314 [Symbiochloris irregularis]|uniref:Aldehyde dehydrogenase domain-containing protein n=1 Tax=Symbiochloris irregularis TaxID=706552 RepID=A0AAW1PAW4_9CHLO
MAWEVDIGRRAADHLAPVSLELGGEDAFNVCPEADLAIPTALRGAFQSCGQSCAGAERFIVHSNVHNTFVQRVAVTAKRLRQGPPLGQGMVDAGAMCLPGLAGKVAELVDDAVAHGAQVLTCGRVMHPAVSAARPVRLCSLPTPALLASALQVGLTAIDNLATTYMCQSLPCLEGPRKAALGALLAARACVPSASQKLWLRTGYPG